MSKDTGSHPSLQMGRVKWKGAFKPAQNTQIQIILRMLKVSSAPLLSHITKTSLFKYTENFTTKKWTFSDEKFL